jgi:hypothetical protein
VRVFEKEVLRGVFGHEKCEITGDWKIFHNEEFCI